MIRLITHSLTVDSSDPAGLDPRTNVLANKRTGELQQAFRAEGFEVSPPRVNVRKRQRNEELILTFSVEIGDQDAVRALEGAIAAVSALFPRSTTKLEPEHDS